jgi:small subunit ribosomal protein S4
MGDPRKQRKKYSTPMSPWQKERIVEEVELLKSYGLKNKAEIYRARSLLKKYQVQAKKFVTIKTEQEELEKQQFLGKMKSFGFVKADDASEVLGLTLGDILERRLQTILHRKGLARSMKQARQFITHRHVLIGDRMITIPSYKVTLEDEKRISFVVSSNLANDEHPERVILEKKEKPEKKMDKRPGRGRPGRRPRRQFPSKK